MSNFKVTGAIEIPKGTNSARIRVISFRKGGEFITAPLELRKTFPPEGYVFANGIRDRFEDNALIEFLATESKKGVNSTDDQYVMEKSAPYGRTGYEVFQVPGSALINELTVDLDTVNQYIGEVDDYFYILVNEALIGPLKQVGDHIEPSKETYGINRDEHEIHYSAGRMYLLKKVTGESKYDCMTREQLGEWLKNQIKNQDLTVNFKELKTALSTQGVAGLDKVRMQRAIRMLDQLDLSLADLQTIAGTGPELAATFARATENAREEFIKPLNDESAAIKKKNRGLEAISTRHKALIGKQEATLASNSKELEHLRNEKDRLIADIRTHVLVNASSPGREGQLFTFDEQLFSFTGESYPSIVDFMEEFAKSSGATDSAQKKAAFNAVIQMREFHCILTASIAPILTIAALSNNCRLFIQQAEPDWLKFEAFYNNGLKQSWAAAHENPGIIHFLVLEDINMASFECYGRPLSDLLTGFRQKLPGLGTGFPKNLWIFGIPLQNYEGNKFGLPLLKETFNKWGAFPANGLGLQGTPARGELSLPPELLTEHDMISHVALDDYFPER